MPAIAHQNKILGNTSGGGSTILVTTSESSLYGQTITLSDGTTTLSGTFSNMGECEFAGVMMTGTLTLACGGVSQSISVPYFGNYSFVFSLFSATVNVTYPYTEGATCILSDGTTTLIATGSPMAFTVPNAGAWTASVELDGNTKTTTTYITTDGQVASINIVFGTINVTYENDFKGVSITCTLGATTITKTAPTTGNTMSFYPPTTGQWTISGTVGGVPYPTTANVTSLSTPVSVNLETIPHGSTATPTDDIQKWLACAGIKDKAYTTLTQVLGDSETYNALLGDSNACAYMKRSTTWSTDICASQYAMNLLGQYDTACDALLSDSTWASAIANSTYFESVLNVKVPTMTSATAPSGEVTSTVNSGDSSAWRAFDGDTTNGWNLSAAGHQWIAYEFPSAVKIVKAVIWQNTTQSASVWGRAASGVFQAYDESISDWADVSVDFKTLSYASAMPVVFNVNIGAYKKYRFDLQLNQAPHLYELQFYGRTTSSEKIHGGNPTYDSFYRIVDGNNVPVTDPSLLDAGTYTIYSNGLAKDPDNLSNDYGKTIRICPNTKEIVVRPDNSLYWYGYANPLVEDFYGSDWVWSLTGNNVTWNIQNVTLGASSGIGTKVQIPDISETYVVWNSSAFSGSAEAELRIMSAKNPANSIASTAETTINTIVKRTLSGSDATGYIGICAVRTDITLYAWVSE